MLNPFKKQPKERLMVSETSSSTWSYHLRLVVEGEEKLGGGAGPAVCGYSNMGWDTKQPLNTYGMKSHLPSRYCQECVKIARDKKLPGIDEVK